MHEAVFVKAAKCAQKLIEKVREEFNYDKQKQA